MLGMEGGREKKVGERGKRRGDRVREKNRMMKMMMMIRKMG